MHLLRSLDGSVAPRPPAYGRRRLIELGALGGVGVLGLGARLFQLQILDGAAHRDRADDNRLRVAAVPAERGLIHDRNRVPLVRNRPSFTVSVLPGDLPRRPEVVYRRLAKLIGGDPQDFARAVARGQADAFTRVPLRTTTDPAVAQTLDERRLELPGVLVDLEPRREYPDGPLTSHVLGYVGPITEAQLAAAGGAGGPYGRLDRMGQAGLEAQLEAALRGAPGRKQVEVDAAGREVGVLSLDPPRPGHDAVLALDLAFQREVHRILAERIAGFEAASAVVVDPATGHVLALAHLPAYDNRLFADGIDEDELTGLLQDPGRPLLNGAVASGWPPGSTFKVITALGALQAGVVRPDTKIHCPGGIRLPGGTYLKCWAAHGWQDMVSALAVSCDTYFYHLGGGEPSGKWPGLGPERLAEWAKLLGLGAPTGIELPGEVGGLVPTPAWKRATAGEAWYPGDTYISAIGQGFYTATPLQMAMVAAALANGGLLLQPRLVLELADGRGRSARRFEPGLVRTLPIDAEHVRVVREGVRAGMLVGTSPGGIKYIGTSYDSNIRELAIAGKTGTAEYGTAGPDGKLPTHGWFIFWAPHEAPKIAGSVFVKHGRGSQEAAKVATQIVRAYFGLV